MHSTSLTARRCGQHSKSPPETGLSDSVGAAYLGCLNASQEELNEQRVLGLWALMATVQVQPSPIRNGFEHVDVGP